MDPHEVHELWILSLLLHWLWIQKICLPFQQGGCTYWHLLQMMCTYYCGKNWGTLAVAAAVSPCGWTVDSNKWQEPALESWPLAAGWTGTSNKDVCGDQPRPAPALCWCATIVHTSHSHSTPSTQPGHLRIYPSTLNCTHSATRAQMLRSIDWAGVAGHNPLVCGWVTMVITVARALPPASGPSTLGTSSPPALHRNIHTLHIVFNDSSFT